MWKMPGWGLIVGLSLTLVSGCGVDVDQDESDESSKEESKEEADAGGVGVDAGGEYSKGWKKERPKWDKKAGKDGGLRALAALNHPPQILDITYDPSRFVSCASTVILCAEAKDPDGDPLSFSWSTLTGGPLLQEPAEVSTVDEGGVRIHCVSLVSPAEAADVELKLVVDDGMVSSHLLVPLSVSCDGG